MTHHVALLSYVNKLSFPLCCLAGMYGAMEISGEMPGMQEYFADLNFIVFFGF